MKHQINPNLDPQQIAELTEYVFRSHADDDAANHHDAVCSLFSYVFPDSFSATATPEEVESLAADEPAHSDDIQPVISAGKVLAYLEHIACALDEMHRVTYGDQRGVFAMCFDERQFLGYLITDIQRELMKLQPFQRAEDINHCLLKMSFGGGDD